MYYIFINLSRLISEVQFWTFKELWLTNEQVWDFIQDTTEKAIKIKTDTVKLF